MVHLLILAFASGVWALQQQAALPARPGAWLAAILVGSGAAVVLGRTGEGPGGPADDGRSRRWPARLATLLACACAAAGGFHWAAWRAQERLADSLPAQWEGRDLTLSGTVRSLPQRIERGVRFAFEVEETLTPGAPVPRHVLLAWSAPAWRAGRDVDTGASGAAVHPGERWRLTVRLRRPHGTANPHGFDLEAWLLESGLRATGYVREGQRLAEGEGGPRGLIERAREAIRGRILGALPDRPYAGVIAALAMGDQSAIPAAQWQVFNRTGIGHLLSISGTHVTMFAALAGGLALALWRRSARLVRRLPARRAAAVAGVAAAALYTALAGFAIPAQRTLYMLAVAAAGLWLARPGSAASVLAWALAFVLLLDPWAVHAAGFWLSFGAVSVLLYGAAGRLAPPGGWRAAVQAQAAVSVGLVPLGLALFGEVSLVSPLANAFAIPLVGLVVVPLALGGLALPFDAPFLLAHALFAWTARALEVLAAWPAATWSQHAPPPWTLAAACAGLALVLAPRGTPGRALWAWAFLPLFLVFPAPPAPGTAEVVVLDVGQGLALLVRTHRHALLYDTGPRFGEVSDAGERVVVPHLRAAGVRRLDALVVSHRDTDHSGGLRAVLQAVPAATLLSSLEPGHPDLAGRRAAGGSVEHCLDGQRWEWDGVRFEMLHPAAESYLDARATTNDLSCVLRVEAGGSSLLVTGDIEARSEARLLAERRAGLRATMLVVPHHGSRTSSTAEFVEATGARHALVAAGYGNRYGHPRADVLARYRRAGASVHRTDLDGALFVRLQAEASVEGQRARAPRYWRERPAPAAPEPALSAPPGARAASPRPAG